MKRWIYLVYGITCHVLFLVIYAWMAAFVGNFGFDYIRTIDSPPISPLPLAILVDALLIAAFAVPHSVMARPEFKKWWTRFVPQPIERSTYVLVSNALMALLLWQWQPIGGVLWDVQNPVGRYILLGLFTFGWLKVPAVSLLINHFDLFGSRQVWLHFWNRPYRFLPFRTPMVYRIVRHPLYVGWTVAFWATPKMTAAHLLFATLMTLYILIAIPFEERDLIAHHGDTYLNYRNRVGGLLPRLGKRGVTPETESIALSAPALTSKAP
ncbi:MAG: methanethiol S-methyltransferase [Phycisphaerae bacterium]